MLPALPADALTAALAFVDGADLARLRSAAKGLIAGADAAAVALCRAKGFARPDWAAPGAPRLLAAAGAWRHPVAVARGRDPFAPRVQHATATVGGRVYCFGGLGDDGPTDALDVLELSADKTVARWVPFATTGDKPFATEGARMTAVELPDGRRYLVVACPRRTLRSDTSLMHFPPSYYVLDLSSRCWTRYAAPLMAPECAHLATLEVDGRPHVVWVTDGCEDFFVLDAAKLDAGGHRAWALAEMPDLDYSPCNGAAAVVVGSTLVVCGGRTPAGTTHFLNDALGFHLARLDGEYFVGYELWSRPDGCSVVRRSHHAAVALADGSILVVGGLDNDHSATAYVIRHKRDPVPFDALGEPGIRVAAAAARVGDAVVVIGGQGALERRGDVDVLVLPSAA